MAERDGGDGGVGGVVEGGVRPRRGNGLRLVGLHVRLRGVGVLELLRMPNASNRALRREAPSSIRNEQGPCFIRSYVL